MAEKIVPKLLREIDSKLLRVIDPNHLNVSSSRAPVGAHSDMEEDKELREFLCGGIFSDVTGELNELAQAKLAKPAGTRYYEVLAPHYAKNHTDARILLIRFQKLWGQPYVAPICTLLLHRALMEHKAKVTGEGDCSRVLNVMIEGAEQLFWGDVHASAERFKALFSYLADGVVFNADQHMLDDLPLSCRRLLLRVAAGFLPYYSAAPSVPRAAAEFPSPAHTLVQGGHTPGEGTDFMLQSVTAVLPGMRAESSLLRYLRNLQALQRYPFTAASGRMTRLRLQAELHSLTLSGGPRYLPRSVNQAAFQTLNRLFPMGQRSRKWVSLAFKVLHPTEWPSACRDALWSSLDTLAAWLRFSWDSTLGAAIRIASSLWPFPRRHKQYP